MAARPLASATVSFGLVSIPIKLYPTADSSKTIHLNRLHKKCGGRMKQQYYCPADDEVVPNEDMVKGYEFSKGQYVLFSDDEVKALNVKSTETIEITEFVQIDQVDPLYFEKAYYLGPNKGGERPYKLLADAMRTMGRCAVAKYAARGKQYLVLLRPYKDGLLMEQLHHHDELRPFEDVPGSDVDIADAELELAKQLVDQITSEKFEPEKYHDEVREKMEGMIQDKVEGKEISALPTEEPKAQIVDLMQALKASLGSGGATAEQEGEAKKAS